MKNTGKTQVNAYRGFRKGGLIKWLSGFLAVLIAVTMLSGHIVPFYGNELDSAGTLAGAGEESGKDVTIHFGGVGDHDIRIHVNHGTGEEEIAAQGSLLRTVTRHSVMPE